jgi:hypothetical protein
MKKATHAALVMELAKNAKDLPILIVQNAMNQLIYTTINV